eukprot:Awhi_evm1s12245
MCNLFKSAIVLQTIFGAQLTFAFPKVPEICETGLMYKYPDRACDVTNVCLITYRASDGEFSQAAADSLRICDEMVSKMSEMSFGQVTAQTFTCSHFPFTLNVNQAELSAFLEKPQTESPYGEMLATPTFLSQNIDDPSLITDMESKCNHLVMIDFQVASRTYGGIGHAPGKNVLINGDQQNVGLYLHELGHNFGLSHANTLDQAGVDSYADEKDFMGGSHNLGADFGTQVKYNFGWIPFSRNVHFTGMESSSSSITLQRVDNGALPNGAMSVTHRIDGTHPNSKFPYNVEAPSDEQIVYMFDFAEHYLTDEEAKAADQTPYCVSVHVIHEITPNANYGLRGELRDDDKLHYNASSYHLDGDNSGTSSLLLSGYECMQPGDNFTDFSSNLKMTVLSLNENSAVIEVTPISTTTYDVGIAAGTGVMLAVVTLAITAVLVVMYLGIIKLYTYSSHVAKVSFVLRVFTTFLCLVAWSMALHINLTYDFAKDTNVWVAFYMLLAHFFFFLVILGLLLYVFLSNAFFADSKWFAITLMILDFFAAFFVGVAGILLASNSYSLFSDNDRNVWIAASVISFIIWLMSLCLVINSMVYIVCLNEDESEKSKRVHVSSSNDSTLNSKSDY